MCGWWVYACSKRSHVGKSFVDAAIGCDLTYHSFLTYICTYLGSIVRVALITVRRVQVSMYSDYTQPTLLTYYVSIASHFSRKACRSGGCTWRGGEGAIGRGTKWTRIRGRIQFVREKCVILSPFLNSCIVIILSACTPTFALILSGGA